MKQCPKCELNWINDDQEYCDSCQPQIPTYKANAITFSELGLKIGDTLVFTGDPKYTAKIISDRTVLFEDKEYYLTPLGQKLLQRIGNPKYQQLGSGIGAFKYDDQDRNLAYRYLRLCKKKTK